MKYGMGITKREGLLKHVLPKKEFEEIIISEDEKELFENMKAFAKDEEELMNKGHNGKFALYYKNENWGISEDKRKLKKYFIKFNGDHAFYCGKIGGD